MATVQGVYIAIFGRPADPEGLAYWNEVTGNGADLSGMIAAFSSSQEYRDRFEGQSNKEIISSIYQSLFGREPEPEGLAFYAEALANGELPIEAIAVNILDGAQETDRVSIDNKEEVANRFTESLDTPEKIAGYTGETAAREAAEFLSEITDDPETVPTDDDIDQAIEEVNDGDYNPPEEEEPGTPGGGGDGEDTTPPTFTSGAEANEDENVAAGTVIYKSAATDQSGPLLYALSGADADAFTIDKTTGEVRIDASPDYETKTSYVFVVTATDTAGNAAKQAVTLTINDVDETVLTTGTDNLVGTSDSDSFTGTLGGSEATFTDGDNIDGGGGGNALTVDVLETNVALPTTFTLSNLKTVAFSYQDGASLAEPIDATRFDSEYIAQLGGSTSISNLAVGQTAAFSNHLVDSTIGYDPAVPTGLVALDGVESGSTLTFDGDGLTTVTIMGTVDDSSAGGDPRETTLDVNASAETTAVSTVKLNLHSDQTVNLGAGFADSVTTFDASDSTGDIFVQFYNFGFDSPAAAATAIQEIRTGSGDDVIVTANDHPDLTTITPGEGDDHIYITGRLGGITIELDIDAPEEAGADTVQIYGSQTLAPALTNITDASEDGFESGIITITGFSSNDTLAFITSDAGAAPLEGQPTIFDGPVDLGPAESGITTLFQTLVAITSDDGVGAMSSAMFEFEGDTYIYQNDGDAAFSDGDGLLRLEGYDGPLTVGDNLLVEQPADLGF
jgi:hypothetical protein